jgi:copper chaperone
MSLKLSVPSIGCASCIETITKAIQSVDASAIIAGDAASKSLDIESQLPEAKIRELIAIAGHEVAN